MTKDEYAEILNLRKLVSQQDIKINKLTNTLNRVVSELGAIKREMIKIRSNKEWNERQ